jgi:hypothetical protein
MLTIIMRYKMIKIIYLIIIKIKFSNNKLLIFNKTIIILQCWNWDKIKFLRATVAIIIIKEIVELITWENLVNF